MEVFAGRGDENCIDAALENHVGSMSSSTINAVYTTDSISENVYLISTKTNTTKFLKLAGDLYKVFFWYTRKARPLIVLSYNWLWNWSTIVRCFLKKYERTIYRDVPSDLPTKHSVECYPRKHSRENH